MKHQEKDLQEQQKKELHKSSFIFHSTISINLMQGTVIKSTGSWYIVRMEDGAQLNCRIKGKFRLKGKKLTNPVAVGDYVDVDLEGEEGNGIIKKILDRKNYVVRSSPRKKMHLHLLAANVDQAVVIMTIRDPDLKQGFIDRFLLMTEPYEIPAVIIFNKADLYEEGDMDVFHHLRELYEKIGYKVLLLSAFEEADIERFKNVLKNKITLIAGHSGVGKSTLVNAVQPDLELITQELSDYSGKGQHTTTFAEMHPLDVGGYIIDTPGIKSLSFINMEPIDVAHNFKEFFERSKNCRFGDCLHLNEPGCAVKEALEKEEVSMLRYSNYASIIEDIQSQNYWERNNEMG